MVWLHKPIQSTNCFIHRFFVTVMWLIQHYYSLWLVELLCKQTICYFRRRFYVRWVAKRFTIVTDESRLLLKYLQLSELLIWSERYILLIFWFCLVRPDCDPKSRIKITWVVVVIKVNDYVFQLSYTLYDNSQILSCSKCRLNGVKMQRTSIELKVTPQNKH